MVDCECQVITLTVTRGLAVNKKDFEKALSNSPNKDFYMDQVDSQLRSEAGPPYLLYLEGFKVTSANNLKSRWAAIRERKRAIKAYDKAGIRSISGAKKKCHVVFTRIIPPGGNTMDDDNMQSGLKWVRDQLTERGYIVDDSRKWITTEYIERRMIKDVENQWGVKIAVTGCEL